MTEFSPDFVKWLFAQDFMYVEYPSVHMRYEAMPATLKTTMSDMRIYYQSVDDDWVYQIVNRCLNGENVYTIVNFAQLKETDWQNYPFDWMLTAKLLFNGDMLIDLLQKLQLVNDQFDAVISSYNDTALRSSFASQRKYETDTRDVSARHTNHSALVYDKFRIMYPELYSAYVDGRQQFDAACSANPTTKDHFVEYRKSNKIYFDAIAKFLESNDELFQYWKSNVTSEYDTERNKQWADRTAFVDKVNRERIRASAKLFVEFLHTKMNDIG